MLNGDYIDITCNVPFLKLLIDLSVIFNIAQSMLFKFKSIKNICLSECMLFFKFQSYNYTLRILIFEFEFLNLNKFSGKLIEDFSNYFSL